MQVLMTYDYGHEIITQIERLGFKVTLIEEHKLSMNDDLSPYEVMICYNPFPSIECSTLVNLKYLMLSSIGVDQVPKALIERDDLIITNNKGGYSPPMGEWIVMMLLMGIKRIPDLYRQHNQGKWHMLTSVQEMIGKQVLFLGTGTIAQEAAKRLNGFDAHLIGANTSGRQVKGFDRCIALKDVNTYLGSVDAVVVCLPATHLTHQIINKDFLSLLKDQAILINVARGALVDEADLMDSLDNDRLLFVALDVTQTEPLDKDHPLWTYERVLITPHNSWMSEMRNQRRLTTIMHNLKALNQRSDLMNVVDIKRGY